MIDGLALGETTPGPLIMVVAFVGFVGGWTKAIFGPESLAVAGVAGATVATGFTFLPSFLFIFIGGLVSWAVFPALMLAKDGFDRALDERDLAILARAPTIQPMAMILTLVAWMITLAERFRDQGAVPVVYLYLIFGSIMLVYMISQPLGVLLGYWFGDRHGHA